jgi:hypothetical protein
MTEQETFNTVVLFLRKQFAKSTFLTEDNNLSCAYRGDNGCKCAAGCLIPDNLYHQSMERHTVRNPRVGPVLEALGHNLDLVDSLQKVHDNMALVDWEKGFKGVAEEFDLLIPC